MSKREDITLEDVRDAHRAMPTMSPEERKHIPLDVGAQVIENLLNSFLEAERKERALFHKKMTGIFQGLKDSIDGLSDVIRNADNRAMEANARSQKNEDEIKELKRELVVRDDTISHLEERLSSLETWREEQTDDGR